jgi:hypothetical protein
MAVSLIDALPEASSDKVLDGSEMKGLTKIMIEFTPLSQSQNLHSQEKPASDL